MAKKRTFGVTLPITGKLYVEVEAANEDEAIEAALYEDLGIEMVEEWAAVKEICQGNFFHGMMNEAYSMEIDADDSDDA